MIRRLLSIVGIVLYASVNLFGQGQHTSLKRAEPFEIVKEELEREMLRARWSAFQNGNVSENKSNEADGLIRKKAFDNLLALKIQEKFLKERNHWHFDNYSDFLKVLRETNSDREIVLGRGGALFGPATFSEETFYDYLMSNALIELKRNLVAEKVIEISEADLQKQFKVMQKDVYAREKYTLDEYRRQVTDAVIELKFNQLIQSYVEDYMHRIDNHEFKKLSVYLPTVSRPESEDISKIRKATTIKRTVYIDSENGDDRNDGSTPETAWSSLNKVNTMTFGPGAEIRLKAGSVWLGRLHPKGSGSQAEPIVIDSYGDGPRPLIDGNGMEGSGVVSLYNQEYWEINNLEIVNYGSEPGDRRGIEIKAENYGLVNHIYLKNLRIHHIKGIVGNGMDAKRTAGIFITTVDDRIKPTRYNDIRIEDCHIHHVDNQGIAISHEVSVSDYPGEPAWEKRKLTNLVVRNNIIHHISKNAMIIRMAEGGLVEHNLCYETALAITGNTIFSRTVKGTVFQYNEGFLNRSPDADGSLYDPDINSPETIWQYSYSHDNAHGLVWFCTNERDSGIVVRYNVSENDKGSLVYFNYDFAGASVYNNVFYIGEHVAPVIIREKNYTDHTYEFYNNIIYNKSPKAVYELATSGKGVQNRTYKNNIFYGFHPKGEPEDPSKITDDPLFIHPGNGNIFNNLNGYKLKKGSPALKTGTIIGDHGESDFFGSRVSNNHNPNRGIYEGDNN